MSVASFDYISASLLSPAKVSETEEINPLQRFKCSTVYVNGSVKGLSPSEVTKENEEFNAVPFADLRGTTFSYLLHLVRPAACLLPRWD